MNDSSFKEGLSYDTETTTERAQSTTQEEEPKENITPIAYHLIKPDAGRGISIASDDDLLSCICFDSCEITNNKEEKIGLETDTQPDESKIPTPLNQMEETSLQ